MSAANDQVRLHEHEHILSLSSLFFPSSALLPMFTFNCRHFRECQPLLLRAAGDDEGTEREQRAATANGQMFLGWQRQRRWRWPRFRLSTPPLSPSSLSSAKGCGAQRLR